MTKRLIYSFAVILLAAASVYAGQEVRAVIPFSFHVGNSLLPSGRYSADINLVPGGVIALRSADGKSHVMALSSGVQSSAGPAPAKLIFHRYGNEYFLFQIWDGSGDMGRELGQSRREKELAAAAARSTETVLAKR